MLPFRWGLLGVVLLIGFTQGASVNSAVNGANDEYIDKVRRSKRSYKRGQTQSQYLNFGQPELDGKADAEATENGSRSTVSGTHGMGQAQSQFSSGDCSGCGVGSPVYEYSTGSPDPLTLGGNVVTYTDSKPSSIIGMAGATPSGTLGPGAGTGGIFAPETGTAGQVGRPGADGSYAPGSAYAPGSGDAGQFGRPGIGVTYGTDNTGQLGRPGTGTTYASGGTYAPGTGGGGGGQIGTPGIGGTYGPGSVYAPSLAEGGQIRRPSAADGYASGSTVAGGEIGRPGTGGAYAPGSVYAPSTSEAGKYGRPGTGTAYGPGTVYTSTSGNAGQIGRPAAGDAYAPGGAYIPGPGGAGQIGTPGTGSAYGPGGTYTPGSADTTSGRPGLGGVYAPSAGGTGQIGAPGTSFGPGYSPATGSADSEQRGAPGIGKPGAGGRGNQGPERPQLVGPPAAPGQTQGQLPGARFGSQVPAYGQGGGQKMPTYTPGVSYVSPAGVGGQVPQYGAGGQQVPTHGTDSQQTPSYGQQGIAPQIPGQIVTQPGSFYRPSSGFAPGLQQVPKQIAEYPQLPGYAPGYPGSTAGEGGRPPGSAVLPGTQYQGTIPQQISQQPGTGTIARPGAVGSQQGDLSQPRAGTGTGVGVGYQPGSTLQPSYQTHPGVGYGQPETGIQSGVAPGYPTDVSLGRPDGGFQQGRVLPSGGGVPPISGSVQPGYGQQGRVQPGNGFVQPGGVQQTGFRQPGISGVGQQGLLPPTSGVQPTVGFDQRGVGYQSGQGVKPGVQQIPSGTPVSGYTPGYGQQNVGVQQGTGAGGGYLPETTYGQPSSFPQGGIRPSGGFPKTIGGTQPGLQQGGQPATRVQPGTSYGQQSGVRPGAIPQAGTQPGIGFGQYPQVGFSQPGAGFATLPAGGVQLGTGVQGSGYGTGYDTTYSQQPPLQSGIGYGQPSTTTQYSPPSYGRQGTFLQPGSGVGIQLPGAGVQTGQSSGAGVPQYGQGPHQIIQPSSTYIPGGVQEGSAAGADDAFSQAESSIGNGQAAANAQGKKNGGTAKTQVQGTYSSSGSFSASAMTSDNDRSASSQVTGGADGAMSQSQGQGGAAQSQAQVQVNEKTGGTKASSQSGGIIHQSQSEVQANDKGGLADAQSSGPGQTSSQAQIGFKPGQDGELVRSVGGGQASAQSGIHSGNSQSQIQGTSKYGVSYHGAAQSASGTKEQVATYREQNRDLFNTISQFGGTDAVTDRVDAVFNPALTSESDIPDLQLKASRTNKEVTNSNKLDDVSNLPDEDEEEEPYDEYEDEEDYYNENPIKMESKSDGGKKLETSPIYRTHTQTTSTQTQQIAVGDPTKKYNIVQNQNGRVQTYSSRTTTETVPNGFRGTVNIEKKFHTKSLEPHKSENKLNITADEKSELNPRTPDSFVTVTKSITGSMDNSKNPPQDNKNFQSTYYTKSSTCGYFTFSCNIVYGANGRSKICRPKAPTNGKC